MWTLQAFWPLASTFMNATQALRMEFFDIFGWKSTILMIAKNSRGQRAHKSLPTHCFLGTVSQQNHRLPCHPAGMSLFLYIHVFIYSYIFLTYVYIMYLFWHMYLYMYTCISISTLRLFIRIVYKRTLPYQRYDAGKGCLKKGRQMPGHSGLAYPRERVDRPFSVFCKSDAGSHTAPPLLVSRMTRGSIDINPEVCKESPDVEAISIEKP